MSTLDDDRSSGWSVKLFAESAVGLAGSAV
jgi:hypothetical protein